MSYEGAEDLKAAGGGAVSVRPACHWNKWITVPTGIEVKTELQTSVFHASTRGGMAQTHLIFNVTTYGEHAQEEMVEFAEALRLALEEALS